MADSKRAGDRRAQHVALLGFTIQTAACGLLFGLALWAGNANLLLGLAHFLLVGVPIWFISYLVLNQIRRVGIEALETEELRRAQASGTSQAIFELDDEALLLEQNRLQWMVRWLLPAGAVIAALVVFCGHLLFWGWTLNQAYEPGQLRRTPEPTLVMWFVIGVGFLCFLYARYAMALARLPQWGLIRGGAVCMAGSALASLLVAIALMATSTMAWVEPLAAYVLPVVLLILGAEFVVNLILDSYRPRTPDAVPRPSFDSRLLGMIGEPGGFAKSIADAVNYQFGFHVSSTWFYQLLQRWLFPIVVTACLAVFLLTGMVIVDAGEEVVVERFGRLVRSGDRAVPPGLHYKWPYPIEVAYRVPARKVSELVIGEATGEEAHEHDVIVWTEKHEYVPELMLLVAAPKTDADSDGRPASAKTPTRLSGQSDTTESVAVSLVMVSVPIEYRIKDTSKYLYTYIDPDKLLEEIAYRYLSDYAASVDIDVLMGSGRETFNEHVKRELQKRLDKRNVGIELLFVGLRDAHPPAKSNVAATFQSVVGAETRRAATIHAAEGKARRIRIAIAGTENQALKLDEAIRARDALPQGSPDHAASDRRVALLLEGDPAEDIAPISGDGAALIAAARATASSRISDALSKALAFSSELSAYRAAPDLFRRRKQLEVYADLDTARKYLIVGDPSSVVVINDTAREAGMDQVLSEGVEKEKRGQ